MLGQDQNETRQITRAGQRSGAGAGADEIVEEIGGPSAAGVVVGRVGAVAAIFAFRCSPSVAAAKIEFDIDVELQIKRRGLIIANRAGQSRLSTGDTGIKIGEFKNAGTISFAAGILDAVKLPVIAGNPATRGIQARQPDRVMVGAGNDAGRAEFARVVGIVDIGNATRVGVGAKGNNAGQQRN